MKNNSESSGGVVNIDFDSERYVHAIGLLDVDDGTEDKEVRLYNAGGTLLKTVPVTGYGENSYEKVILDQDGVAKIEIDIRFSFGLASLLFCEETTETTDCSIDISNINVSNCIDHPLEDVAAVDITVEWENAPANDTIEVLLNGKTEYINVAGGDISPHTLSLMVPADGATNIPVSATWRHSNACAGDSDTFDSPSACSTGEVDCDILYLSGNNKFNDAEPWDQGMELYLDRVNGAATVTTAFTKNGSNGLELYNPSNTSSLLNITLSDYDLIVISTSSSGQTSTNLVNACLLYTSPSPRDATLSRMPSSA